MKPKIWDFIINTEPIPQERPRFTVSYRKGRAYGRVYESQKMKKYKEFIGWELKRQYKSSIIPKYIPIAIECIFFLKEKNFFKMDIDNLIKALLDAMQGIIFENDNQIIRLSAGKYISKELGIIPQPPCIEIKVIVLPDRRI